MNLPTKQALHAKIQELVQMDGGEYTRWRQRLRHALVRRKWAAHGFVPNVEEFQPFLQLHDVLISRFGVPVAETKLFHVLDGITKERRRRYDVAYRGRDLAEEDRVSLREKKKLYMRRYREQKRREHELLCAEEDRIEEEGASEYGATI